MIWPFDITTTATLAIAAGTFFGMLLNPFFMAKFMTMISGKVHYVVGIKYPDKVIRPRVLKLLPGQYFNFARQRFKHPDTTWPTNNINGVPFQVYDISDAVAIVPKAVPTEYTVKTQEVLDDKGKPLVETVVEKDAQGNPITVTRPKYEVVAAPKPGAAYSLVFEKMIDAEKFPGSANVLDNLGIETKSMIEAEALTKMIQFLKDNLQYILIGVGIIAVGLIFLGMTLYSQNSTTLSMMNSTLQVQMEILRNMANLTLRGA